MKPKNWEEAIKVIHAMNVIVRHFNDEEWITPWLSNGVPDDCVTLDDLRNLYENDSEFDDKFEQLQSLFCKLITYQCARINMPVEGTDFPPTIGCNSKLIIYCHQFLDKGE